MKSQLRIISLVPSITETLVYLGHVSSLIGCTNFCTQPQKGLKHITKIGGTKNPDIEKIKQLSPTHIIMNKEENRLEDFHSLQGVAEIMTTYPQSPEDVPDMIEELSTIFANKEPFHQLSTQIHNELSMFTESELQHKSLYFIWKDPWMLAGPETYIGNFLKKANHQLYPLSHSIQYPSYDLQEMIKWDIKNIFLSSEPWPFRKRELIHFRDFINKGINIFHIDGIQSSWHGASTLKGLQELRKWTIGHENTCIQRWS